MKNKNIEYSSKINDMILYIKEHYTITPFENGHAKNAEDFFNKMIK